MKQYPDFGTEREVCITGAGHRTLYFECRDGAKCCGHHHLKATAANECLKSHPGMKINRIVEETTIRVYEEVD